MSKENFSQQLLRLAEEDPHGEALVLLHHNDDDLHLTRQGLVEHAGRWAAAFQKAGLQPGQVVVLILVHCKELVFAYWGAVLAGLIPSILPYLTEKLNPERYRADLTALAAVTQPAAVVTCPEFAPEVNQSLKNHPAVVLTPAMLETNQVVPNPADFQGLQRPSASVALLQHSSGTTGLQKGVALSHEAVFNQLEAYSAAIQASPRDVIVSWLPLYHDMGLIACFLMPLLSGIPLVMMSPFDWVRSPVRLLQAVSRFGGTLSWLPNFAYAFCASKIRERELQGLDLSTWRAVINCSEPMRLASMQAFAERFTPFGLRPGALATCYAMAENTFAVTQSEPGADLVVDYVDQVSLQEKSFAQPAAPGEGALAMLSAGKPVDGTQIKVFNEAHLALAERQVGELALRSNCMLSGYYNRPDETEKSFHEGWYLTGDIGYIYGGEAYIVGRRKDLIIVGGKNIYPQDIEQTAMQVEGVHAGRVAAFGLFNEANGTETVALVFEADTEDEARLELLITEVRSAVFRATAIALADVVAVGKGWLIKTSSGKTARAANRDKYLEWKKSR